MTRVLSIPFAAFPLVLLVCCVVAACPQSSVRSNGASSSSGGGNSNAAGGTSSAPSSSNTSTSTPASSSGGLGDADPTFGDGGRIAPAHLAFEILPLQDGSILSCSPSGQLTRITPDGAEDANFGLAGVTDVAPATSTAAAPVRIWRANGKTKLLASVVLPDAAGHHVEPMVATINGNGSLSDVVVPAAPAGLLTPTSATMARGRMGTGDANGRWAFLPGSPTLHPLVVAGDGSGGLPGFGNTGYHEVVSVTGTTSGSGVAVWGDRVAATVTTLEDGGVVGRLLVLTATGAPDQTIGANGLVSVCEQDEAGLGSAVLLPDSAGGLIVVAVCALMPRGARTHIRRFLPSGERDTAWAGNGEIVLGSTTETWLFMGGEQDSQGRVVLTGTHNTTSATLVVMRLLANGMPDSAARGGGVLRGPSALPTSFKIDGSDRALVAAEGKIYRFVF